MKTYTWKKEQMNNKWMIVCSSHEHMPMIEKSKDGKYCVRLLNGKLSKNNSFKDAEKKAIEIYKKFSKFNKKFDA